MKILSNSMLEKKLFKDWLFIKENNWEKKNKKQTLTIQFTIELNRMKIKK